MLNKLIDEADSISLTDNDLRRICFNRLRIVTYDEFITANSIFDFFTKYNYFIIFYRTHEETTGHWCAVVYHPNEQSIEFFDSYGFTDKQVLDLSPNSYEDTNGYPALTKLLNTSGMRIQWPLRQLQSKNRDITTCGRYAALRCRLADLPQSQFYALFSDKKIKPDALVSLLTVAFSEDFDDYLLRHTLR